MNKTRRAALNALQDRITEIRNTVENLIAEADAIRDDLQNLRDEEQDGFDNLSDGLQASERGQAMEEAVSAMDTALDSLTPFTSDTLTIDDLDDAFNSIEDAKGQPQ